ncbi:MAG: ABC transporter permease [Treponema sp.]|nr:ABC transporter permease [Treponema sp.]
MLRNQNILGAGKDFLARLLISEFFVLVLGVVYFFLISAFVPTMLNINNIRNIFSNMWPLFAIAIGQTFVLLLGGIDLSQTSVMALSSVIGAVLMTRSANPDVLGNSPLWGWFLTENGGPLAAYPQLVSTLLGIGAMLVTGLIIGTINGVLIAKLSMPPFMVTLIAQMFYSALAILITKSQNVMGLPDSFCVIGAGRIGFIPYSFFVAVALAAAAQFVLSRTVRGRWIYSTGANIRAAKVSGVPTVNTTVFVYAFSGFCAAAGSVLYSGRLMMGRPTLGANILMDIMGATIIGGTSLFGGKGKITWTLFGVLFYTIMTTSLTQLRLDAFTIDVVKGLIILAAGTMDVMRTHIQRRVTIAAAPAAGRKVA